MIETILNLVGNLMVWEALTGDSKSEVSGKGETALAVVGVVLTVIGVAMLVV